LWDDWRALEEGAEGQLTQLFLSSAKVFWFEYRAAQQTGNQQTVRNNEYYFSTAAVAREHPSTAPPQTHLQSLGISGDCIRIHNILFRCDCRWEPI
jgi:hypothetical protein